MAHVEGRRLQGMKILSTIALALICPALSGCIVRAAADVVTAPVRAGAQAADWMTTSQDEADRERGREMRKEERRQRQEREKREQY